MTTHIEEREREREKEEKERGGGDYLYIILILKKKFLECTSCWDHFKYLETA